MCFATGLLPAACLAAAAGQWTLIDFGLSRRYLDDEGRLLPERTDASFRGSSTYASAQVRRTYCLRAMLAPVARWG